MSSPCFERLTLNGNIADLGTFLDRCTHLRVISITFRSIDPSSLEAAMATLEAVAARGAAVSLLGIHIPSGQSADTVHRASARLSLQELVFTHPPDAHGPQYGSVHASSAPPRSRLRCITSASHGFWMACSPSSNGCLSKDALSTTYLGSWHIGLPLPRLCVLKVEAGTFKRDIRIHSGSLQEIVFGTCTACRGINIVTPILKQLKMEVKAGKDISVFISAPMLEKVLWRRSYTGLPNVFGFWRLQYLSLETPGLLTDKNLQNLSSDRQGLLTNNRVLLVEMRASVCILCCSIYWIYRLNWFYV